MNFKVDAQKLIQTANRLVGQFVDRTSHFEMFMELNEALLEATGSEYGFIARVFRNEKGPYIKTVALSNIAWNDETRKLYAENAERGMIFDNLDSIFGQVVKTGRLYISHNSPKDPHAAGIPHGHPKLDCFMGLPLVRNEVLIGMIGLANGEGYCEDMASALKPLMDATSHVLYATGLQQPLVPEGNYFSQPDEILNKFNSGVLTVDSTGNITAANQAATVIFGYSHGEVIGMRLQSLIPPTGESEMYDRQGDLCIHEHQLGRPFEATGFSKVESYFPVEALLGETGDDSSKQYAVVIRDISEEKQRERFKDEFISMVSHELRTPLTTVYVALSALDNPQHRPESATEVNKMISIATRNCERLMGLVDEILDYEKLNLNELEFHFESVPLEKIFELARETTRVVAERVNVRLDFQACEKSYKVAADATRMSQVLINLIANAIRASSPGEVVHVGFEPRTEQRCVTLSVADDGKGISESFVKEVFEPFKQFENDSGGAGLGLAICKRFVEHHGSQITCESELGVGTRFQFDLFEYCDLQDEIATIQETESTCSQKRVLWLESNNHHYQFALGELEQSGVEFFRVENTQLAKQALGQSKVDLILIGYPVVLQSCVSFVEEIRSLPQFANLPIVLYSNGLSQQVAVQLEEHKVDHSIKTSWNLQGLKNRIAEHMGLRPPN